MKKLNMYMRAVAVTSLLVVGGVGVYKGRAMLGKKDDAQVADKAAASQQEDAKTGEGTTAAAADNPDAKPTASALAAVKDKAASATDTKKSNDKAAKLGSFKFGGFGNKTGDKSATDANSTEKRTPATTASADRAGGYSLSDSPAEATPEDNQYAASAPPAAPALGGYGGDYGAAEAAPVTDAGAPPEAPAMASENASGYGAADNGTSGNGTDYAAALANVAGSATAPPASAPYGDTTPADSGYGAPPPAGGYGDPQPTPAASDYAASPVPEAPAYGTADPGGYAATPMSEASPVAASPTASTAATSSLRKSKAPRNTTFGATASDVAGSAMPTTTEAPSAAPPSAPSFGALSDATVSTPPPASAPPAEAPAFAGSSAASSRSLPPNRLPSNPLGTSLPSQTAPTAQRYAQDTASSGLGAPAAMEATADITPITSTVQPHLEGPQTPTIAVEKFAPPEVQVGKAALFEIVVKNVGKVAAYDVTVVDEIPQGTRFQQATPQPTQSPTGALVWKLGAMKPGEEQVIALQLVPEAEGEIGSVAQVSFQAQAGARSVVTQPKLEIRHQAPPQVHAGDNATVVLTISNSGTGAATGVLLQSDIPQGFSHPAGQELEFEVGTLRPNESKQVELVLKAEQAGQYQAVFVVRGDGDLLVQDATQLDVVAPSLQVAVTGPKKRFVERQATHAITIANPGTASAKDVDIVAHLPRGFKFISADHQGQYDSRQHAVVWGLEELPPNASGSVQLTTLPVEAGEQKLRVEGRSANGLTAEFEQLVSVDAIAELPFSVADLADPIEVGSETTYEIRLANRGAKDATNVVIAVDFPPDVKPLSGEGAARATVAGQRLEFAAIPRMSPGEELILKVHAQGLRPGDHRVAVSLTSDETQTPITREESTRVYADQ
jgi:uncharacterized repeat protein (TIGR01451 family)